MAVPSKSFTVIANGPMHPDSPVTKELMQECRDNLEHIRKWIGDDFPVSPVDHNCDGVNSAPVKMQIKKKCKRNRQNRK